MTRALKKMMRNMRKDDRFMWQAGSALIVGSVVLAGIAYLAPKKEEAPVVVKPITAQPSRVNAFGGVRLEGKAAIVYDLKTGEVLYERNAEAQLPLASITKLLTILAASDALTDTAPVTITESALAQEGESGFALGETFAFSDIARLALVSSSNDATAAIAEAASQKKGVAGTQLLASAAAGAQLTQTYANNGTGLDESTEVSGGYGSAHDVALLAGALLKKAPHLAGATIDPSIRITSTTRTRKWCECRACVSRRPASRILLEAT